MQKAPEFPGLFILSNSFERVLAIDSVDDNPERQPLGDR
jgi:hypothetical protein